jgi:hypothetical protein
MAIRKPVGASPAGILVDVPDDACLNPNGFRPGLMVAV